MSKKTITAYIPWNGNEYTHKTIENFASNTEIETIYLLTREASGITHPKCHDLLIDFPTSSKTIRTISDATNTSHIPDRKCARRFQLRPAAAHRFAQASRVAAPVGQQQF
ncbi:MAG: hypothetical protein LC662_06060 [Rhodothermaceae bacterium]|nr:hypothetical protein [Rhodothermaceae bacterium]